MKSQIMYVEQKTDGLAGPGVICRVQFSKTGKTIYLDGRSLQSLKGTGYKANYFDTVTGDQFWVSRPKKSGQDTLYSGTIVVTDDAQEEYWTEIRNRPDLIGLTKFRSHGKHQR
ncbi:MAG: 1-deoxy-D-xylulose-5-phosphate synthase [Nitrospira sp.]